MNVRVQLGLLIAVCLLANQPAYAQQYQSQGYQPQGYGSAGNMSPGQVTPAGFHHQGYAPHQYSGPGCDELTAYQLLPDDRGFLFDRDSLLDLTMLEQSKGTWIRAELWNASVSHRSGRILGAPTRNSLSNNIVPNPNDIIRNTDEQFELSVADPIGLFQIQGANIVTIPVQAATTRDLDFEDMTGVQVTMGIPLTKRSWLEMGAWGIEDTTTHLSVPRIPPTSLLGGFGVPSTLAIVIPLTTNGLIGNRDVENGVLLNRDRVIVYDSAYFSNYKIDSWSAEVNYVHDYINNPSGFSLKPLIGYNYTEYNEDLNFGGSFDNSSGYLDTDPAIPFGLLTNPVTGSISSSAENSRNEMQIGFRSELEHKWFTLGVEPKVGMGLNWVRGQVTANNVRAPGDIGLLVPAASTITDNGQIVTTKSNEVEFSATFDLGLYANIHLHDRIKLRVGYDLMYLANMGVADNQIKYNENAVTVTVVDPIDPTIITMTTTSTADVRHVKGLQSRALTALSIGGEIILW